MRTLEEVRKDIDRLDQELINILVKRLNLTNEVKDIKKQSKRQIVDVNRENAIIERLQMSIETEHHGFLKALYKLIFSYSRDLQKR